MRRPYVRNVVLSRRLGRSTDPIGLAIRRHTAVCLPRTGSTYRFPTDVHSQGLDDRWSVASDFWVSISVYYAKKHL